MYSSVVLHIFKILCSHHFWFIIPNRNSVRIRMLTPLFPPPQPLVVSFPLLFDYFRCPKKLNSLCPSGSGLPNLAYCFQGSSLLRLASLPPFMVECYPIVCISPLLIRSSGGGRVGGSAGWLWTMLLWALLYKTLLEQLFFKVYRSVILVLVGHR